jgi:PmbA protein
VVGAVRRGEQLEAYFQQLRRTHAKVAVGLATSVRTSETCGLGLRLVSEGRMAYAATSDLSDLSLRRLIAEARSGLRHATIDHADRLPQPQRAATLHDLACPPEPTGLKLELARALCRPTVGSHAAVEVTEAEVGDRYTVTAIASSTGIAGCYERSQAWCRATATATAGQESKRAVAFALSRSVADLDVAAVASHAADRAAGRLRPKTWRTRRIPILIDAEATSQLLQGVEAALCADAVLIHGSPLADRQGTQVMGGAITVVDDGRLPGGPVCSPFDDEGVPTTRTVLVDAGVLRGFLHSTSTAHRLGQEPTGTARRPSYRDPPAPRATHLFVVPGRRGTQSILERMDEVLHVEGFHGGISAAYRGSGRVSLPIVGSLVQNGARVHAVQGATLEGKLLDFLADVREVGRELHFRPHGGALGGTPLLLSEGLILGR